MQKSVNTPSVQKSYHTLELAPERTSYQLQQEECTPTCKPHDETPNSETDAIAENNKEDKLIFLNLLLCGSYIN